MGSYFAPFKKTDLVNAVLVPGEVACPPSGLIITRDINSNNEFEDFQVVLKYFVNFAHVSKHACLHMFLRENQQHTRTIKSILYKSN